MYSSLLPSEEKKKKRIDKYGCMGGKYEKLGIR
jgi:hypothetical protein